MQASLRSRRRLLAGTACWLGAAALAGCGAAAARRYRYDFTRATPEDALSAGGTWVNNRQGVGAHRPPGNMTSMRVGLASDGRTMIAMATHGGVDYDDSFAFVPGFPGDQFIEAAVYKEPGYNPNAQRSNHEIELLLGCASGPGTHRWNECLFNAGGGVDVVFIDGGPRDFHPVGDTEGRNYLNARHGDLIRAEKIGPVVSLYLNGLLKVRYDGRDPKRVAHGDGIGIGGFIRPGAVHDKYGFMAVQMGSL